MYWHDMSTKDNTVKSWVYGCGFLALFALSLAYLGVPAPKLANGDGIVEIDESTIEDEIYGADPETPSEDGQSSDEYWEDYIDELIDDEPLDDTYWELYDLYGLGEDPYYDDPYYDGGSSADDPSYDPAYEEPYADDSGSSADDSSYDPAYPDTP